MSLKRWSGRWMRVLAYSVGMFFWSGVAHAGGTTGTLPFVGSLEIIMNDFTGPVAVILLLMIMAGGLIAWAFFERNEKVIHVLKAIVAASLIFSGLSFLSSLGITAAVV